MPNIWMVSAHFGIHTKTWVEGGYAAVGWLPEVDLTSVSSRDEIFRRYREAHPDETRHEVGANAGQLATFILKIQPGGLRNDPLRSPHTRISLRHSRGGSTLLCVREP